MSIDYDRLRELLDKATPGPWEFHEEQEWEHVAGPEYPPMLTRVEHTVEGNDGGLLFGNFNDAVLEEHPDNLRLAALAPDMARELLRLHDGMKQVADDLGENAEYAPNVPRQEAYLEAEQRLTDLLNGDTE